MYIFSLNIKNEENEIDRKIHKFNNIIELKDSNKKATYAPIIQTTSKNLCIDRQISINDLKAVEIDENRLKEESNFLLNYDNDLIIKQLSESLINKKAIEFCENDNNIKEDVSYNKILNINNNDYEKENFKEENILDINKSIQFDINENNKKIIKVSKPNEINDIIYNQDLKNLISKDNYFLTEKNRVLSNFNNYNKIPMNAKTPNKDIYEKKTFIKKNFQNSFSFSKNKSSINYNKNYTNIKMNTTGKSMDDCIDKKLLKFDDSKNIKNKNIKYENLSNSNVSSNNCSREKTVNQYFKKIFEKSPIAKRNNKDNTATKIKTMKLNNNMTPNFLKNSSNIQSPNILNNRIINNSDISIINSKISDINIPRLQHNFSVINEKIAKLQKYQRNLKEKINEAEFEKNKILKNKNEEISYIKKNVNDKEKVLKNLLIINERNQKIIEISENTINNLKIELKNKCTEISNLLFNKNIISANNNNGDINSNMLKWQLFTGFGKFGEDINGNCCIPRRGKLSHSMQHKNIENNLIKDNHEISILEVILIN